MDENVDDILQHRHIGSVRSDFTRAQFLDCSLACRLGNLIFEFPRPGIFCRREAGRYIPVCLPLLLPKVAIPMEADA